MKIDVCCSDDSQTFGKVLMIHFQMTHQQIKIFNLILADHLDNMTTISGQVLAGTTTFGTVSESESPHEHAPKKAKPVVPFVTKGNGYHFLELIKSTTWRKLKLLNRSEYHHLVQKLLFLHHALHLCSWSNYTIFSKFDFMPLLFFVFNLLVFLRLTKL